MADGLNEARALRVAELMNDYRTLMMHISQQNVASRPEEYNEEGFVVVRECQAAAQRLMAANYQPAPVVGSSGAETEKAELQRVIIDSSARRFQAHKIYLRAAAARRWAMSRESALRGQAPTANQATALKAANTVLQQELARITDQHVVADLRNADLRAGHWVDDDPSLDVLRRWIQGR
ncbi:hypothetical protein N7468_004372 [Penicillium chermesinum]|uniref:Uncharacterized protein n=1 Tax=Penicillium chermesinum TaxID=63820 RepID=A0A9W9TT45_9EURO|nr:uncharacterized protein N7468_004372 [Penicillium chermesinum]KAJ5239753.1 hypothetical protein N7468_004372 [Penicillium chermesinum]KAJ6166633.1 hypothetical protein N7470_002080 [Penicillium chermesinum]